MHGLLYTRAPWGPKKAGMNPSTYRQELRCFSNKLWLLLKEQDNNLGFFQTEKVVLVFELVEIHLESYDLSYSIDIYHET